VLLLSFLLRVGAQLHEAVIDELSSSDGWESEREVERETRLSGATWSSDAADEGHRLRPQARKRSIRSGTRNSGTLLAHLPAARPLLSRSRQRSPPRYSLPTKHFPVCKDGQPIPPPPPIAASGPDMPDVEVRGLKLRLAGQRRTIHELEKKVSQAKADSESKEEAIKMWKRRAEASASSSANALCRQCGERREGGGGTVQRKKGPKSEALSFRAMCDRASAAEEAAENALRCMEDWKRRERRAREASVEYRHRLHSALAALANVQSELEAAQKEALESRKIAKAHEKLSRKQQKKVEAAGRSTPNECTEKTEEQERMSASQWENRLRNAENAKDAAQLKASSFKRELHETRARLADMEVQLQERSSAPAFQGQPGRIIGKEQSRPSEAVQRPPKVSSKGQHRMEQPEPGNASSSLSDRYRRLQALYQRVYDATE
jgi:hypothetical protein